MATNFLDKTGLSYFWSKIKSYVDGKFQYTTVSLSSSGWDSSKQQTVTVNGITSDSIIVASPIPSSMNTVMESGIYCSAQGSNSLTFTCATPPSTSVTYNISIQSTNS